MSNTNKKVYISRNEVDEKLKNLSGNGSSADWNQNDPNGDGYIENRPFYEEVSYTAVSPEITYEFSNSGSPTTLEGVEPFELIDGATYKIVWDGIDYICECFSFSGEGVGNVSIFVGGEPTSNAPFWIWGATPMVAVETAGTHTFTVYKYDAKIHKIDEKYLPDTITSDTSNFVVVTRDSDDRTKATLTEQEIYNLHKEGKFIVFIDTDYTYYLNYAEIDPTAEATFVSCCLSSIFVITITNSGKITETRTIIGNYKLTTANDSITGAINEVNTLVTELNAKHIEGTESTILISPNGTKFSITVGDDGVLSATEITA